MLIKMFEIHALEKAKLGDGWVVSEWEDLEVAHDGIDAMRIEVMYCPDVITSGKLKGRPDWSKADKETRRNIYVTGDEHRAWLPKWAERNNKCPHCAGDGRQMVRWHHIEGTTWRPCEGCTGTGLWQPEVYAKLNEEA